RYKQLSYTRMACMICAILREMPSLVVLGLQGSVTLARPRNFAVGVIAAIGRLPCELPLAVLTLNN
ncbi:MAG: hypothetical protein WBB94_01795, partial [Candidatus Saccharimonadaceae bacterium]